jgi:hypothetical protein
LLQFSKYVTVHPSTQSTNYVPVSLQLIKDGLYANRFAQQTVAVLPKYRISTVYTAEKRTKEYVAYARTHKVSFISRY